MDAINSKPPKKKAATRKNVTRAKKAAVSAADTTPPVLAPVGKLMALFAGYEHAHGTHGMPERDPNGIKWSIKKTAKTLQAPPTPEMWLQHVAGKRPLGVVPIRDDNSCVWGSIDIDKYNLNLLEIVQRVEQAKLPLVPCVSKSGGLHLFLFTSEAISAKQMQAALRALAAQLGFADSEIFPKQDDIDPDRGDSGSWMVMPYYGDTFEGKLKRQHGLKKTGAEMTLEEFITAAEKARVTAVEVERFAKPTLTVVDNTRPKSNVVSLANVQRNKSEWKRQRDEAWRDLGSDPNEAFADGPPCLQRLARSGISDGGRNNALLHMGIFLKKAFPDTWKKQLEYDNQKYMKPPLDANEVLEVQKRLDGKKNYQYLCSDQPMCRDGICDTAVCMTRPYGVGQGTKFPVIEYIDKEIGDETIFYVKLKGIDQEVVLKSAKQLTRLPDFRDACADQVSFSFELFADKIWVKIYRHALENAGTRAPDMTRRMHFAELFENWLNNRGRASAEDGLLGDKPWLDDDNERYLFRLSCLFDHLKEEGFKLTYHEMGKWVREDFSGYRWPENEQGIKKIKTKAVKIWCVPSGNIAKMPEIDPPPWTREQI